MGCCFFLLLIHCRVLAQQNNLTLHVGTRIPLDYFVGLNYRPINHFSVTARAGLLTWPYDKAIIGVVNLFDTDKQLMDLIDRAFKIGTIYGISTQYHFKSFYGGLLVDYIVLYGKQARGSDLNTYFKKDFSSFNNAQYTDPLTLKLTCRLFQPGFTFGYLHQKLDSKWGWQLALNVTKNVHSINTFASNRPRLEKTKSVQDLYKEMNTELADVFVHYAYAPSIQANLFYRF